MEVSEVFKREAIWVVVAAMLVAILQVLMDFDPLSINDWRTWALSLAGVVVRAGAAAGVVLLGKRQFSDDEEPR